MEQLTRRAALGLVLAAGATPIISSCASSGASTTAAGLGRTSPADYEYTGEVYLLRGLANVFSTGLDVLNDKFRRRGVNSRVDNHAAWQGYADDILARSKQKHVSFPLVIMGHSLGGNASVQMAKYLGDRGVPVAYVVAFDPTITTSVGPNVEEVVNFYLPNGKNIVKEEPGTTAKIYNIDVTPIGVDHFNVEKNDQLHVRVITKTLSLMKPTQRLEAGTHR